MVAAAIRYGVCLRNTRETRTDLANSLHEAGTEGSMEADAMSIPKEESDSCWKTPVGPGETPISIPVIKLPSSESVSSKHSQNIKKSTGGTRPRTSGEGISSRTSDMSRDNGLTHSTDNSVKVQGSVCRVRGSDSAKGKQKEKKSKLKEKRSEVLEKKQEDKFLSAKSSQGRCIFEHFF